MKNSVAGLLLGSLLLAQPAVQAATHLDAGAFTIDWLDGYHDTHFDMQLLSSHDGTVQIALSGIAPLNDATADTRDGPRPVGRSNWNQLGATVDSGYRITSLSWSAIAAGTLAVGELEPCRSCEAVDGSAHNGAALNWRLMQGGSETPLQGAYVVDVEGATTLAAHAAGALQGMFGLDLFTSIHASATPSYLDIWGDDYHYTDYSHSLAVMEMRDVVLTVQVSPVPEPGTWAMLLGGFGILGAAARRRRHVRVPGKLLARPAAMAPGSLVVRQPEKMAMQPLLRATCAAVLLSAGVASSPARAGVPVIDTVGFTLTALEDVQVADLSVLANYPEYASFSLWGVGRLAHTYVDTTGYETIAAINHWETGYRLSVKEGYKITGITLAGEFYGSLRPAQYAQRGYADNGVGMRLTLDRPGELPITDVRSARNLDGRQAFGFDLTSLQLTGELTLSMLGDNGAGGSSVWYTDGPGEDFWLGSYADAGIDKLQMRIAVAPVPEPHAYLALAGGLGVIAMLARRRRRTGTRPA